MKIKEDNKNKTYMQVININININSPFKVCKISNKKFLFYSEIKNDYYIFMSYSIYSIEFKNNKYIINEQFKEQEKPNDIEIDSFFSLNEKYLIQFSYNNKEDENNNLIRDLINNEIFQLVYKYITNLKVVKEKEDIFTELYSNIEIDKKPNLYINSEIDEIP